MIIFRWWPETTNLASHTLHHVPFPLMWLCAPYLARPCPASKAGYAQGDTSSSAPSMISINTLVNTFNVYRRRIPTSRRALDFLVLEIFFPAMDLIPHAPLISPTLVGWPLLRPPRALARRFLQMTERVQRN